MPENTDTPKSCEKRSSRSPSAICSPLPEKCPLCDCTVIDHLFRIDQWECVDCQHRWKPCETPEFLYARCLIAEDLYREGKVTREEAFRVGVDSALGRNSGDLVMRENDDHKAMMEGEGSDHEEYRRREKIYQENAR